MGGAPIQRMKDPASAMRLRVVVSNEAKMTPHWFLRSRAINSEEYLNVLQTVLTSWIDETFPNTCENLNALSALVIIRLTKFVRKDVRKFLSHT